MHFDIVPKVSPKGKGKQGGSISYVVTITLIIAVVLIAICIYCLYTSEGGEEGTNGRTDRSRAFYGAPPLVYKQ